jgi:DNA polymerase-3 subunit delta
MTSYLLESLDSLALEKTRNDLIKKNNFLDALVSEYDLEEVLLEAALEDLDTYSFLSSKKVIVIKKIESIKYEDFKKDVEHLFKYIDNPSSDNLLIIEANKLNNTTKICKELKKKCEYIKVEIDPVKFIKSEFKDYKIDTNTINYLNDYCLGDITKISNECSKLKNYKYDDKVITKEDIDELVVKKMGDSKELTFAFTRSLALKDKKDALEKYRELLSYNIEPLSIIGLLGSQIRIIYQVKLLEKKRLSDREIAAILEEKSDYRIKKTRELTRLYSEEELLQLMQKLSDIDLKIKTSEVDGNSLIELFIINL